MRNWEEVDCPNAHECFNGGHWGKGVYDDEESSMAGGKPWCRCWCMTEQEHAYAQEELEDAMKTDCIPLSVESLADALQDSVPNEYDRVRAAAPPSTSFDDFVDALYEAGWRSPCDAQHTKIEKLWRKLWPQTST